MIAPKEELRHKEHKGRAGAGRVWAAVAAIVAAAGCGAWLVSARAMRGGAARHRADKPTGRLIAEVAPATAVREEASPSVAQETVRQRHVPGGRTFDFREREELYAIPEEELSREELLLKRAFQRHERRRPLFEEPTDQLLAMATSVEEGAAMPPLPGGAGMEEAFRESLKREIVILESDAPEVRAVKERVIRARAELAAALEGGESMGSVLAEHQRLHNDNAALYREAQEELTGILDQGDTEGARRYCDAMNAAFRQMGVRQLKMPDDARREQLREMRRRLAQRRTEMKGNEK